MSEQARPISMSAAPSAGLAAAVLNKARLYPTAPAVLDGNHCLSYADLDTRSAAVAGALHARGIRPGQAVAVCLPRSWQLVCAMLGALRAGATVVPLDAQSPPERRRHILSDAAVAVAVYADATTAEAARTSGELPDEVVALSVTEALAGTGDGMVRPGPAPVPFLFYTSGSTGRPKGVEVRDAGILRLAKPGYLPVVGGARYACLSNPAFDALSFEVWVPLLTGGSCVIVDDDTAQHPDVLAAEVERLRIDVLFITVALFNAIVDEVPHCFSNISHVLVGGEQLNADLIARWYRHNSSSRTQLYNVYGPTEATTFALSYPIPRGTDQPVVPIGRPLPGTVALAVVDGTREAETGELAELLLSGDALAAGYRNLPEETARRFVTLPWYDGEAQPHYRTGDLVRRDAEGLFTYVERADRQIKVRGFRIEPGELERCVTAHPAVRQAYVCTDRDAYGVNELLAYVVLGAPLTYEEFARHVADSLPAYMRPHRTYLLESLPLNANGKVDRTALLRREETTWRKDTPAVAPAALTATLREVLRLTSELIGIVDLRGSDRWTAIGGDSLKALRLRFEVRRQWGVELSQACVLRSDLAGLADEIDAARRTGRPSPYPVPAAPAQARFAPATAEQERLWFLMEQNPGSAAYHVPLAFHVEGKVDVPALRRALRALVSRHTALRTSFKTTAHGLFQSVADPYDPWREDDRPMALLAEPFDLSVPEMLRACWTPEPSDCGGELNLMLHHIAIDGWSLNILFADLSDLYAQELKGSAPGPTTAADTYTPLDFAVWQQDWFRSEGYQNVRAGLRELHETWTRQTSDAASGPLEALHEPGAGLLHTLLEAAHRAALDRLCGALGLTRFQILLSVYAWSLYGVTGRSRLRVAAPVAGRPVEQFDAGVGMYANTVLLPVEVEPCESLRSQVRRLARRAQEVLDHQDVALDDALAQLPGREGHTTPFDFLLVVENTDFGALTMPGCRIRPRWVQPAAAKCPLTLSVLTPATVSESDSGLECLWEYDTRHFDAAEAAAIADLFRQGLELLTRSVEREGPHETAGTSEAAETCVSGATLRPQNDDAPTPAGLVEPYRRRLADPGCAQPAAPMFRTIAEGFTRQVARTPDAPAVATPDGARTLTYADLDALAARLTAELGAEFPLPVPDDGAPRRIALHLPPSIEHTVALLALARLNVTAVPLDPAYPPALLRQILDQAAPLCVLVPPDAKGDPLEGVAPPTLLRLPLRLPGKGQSFEKPPQVEFTHAATRPLYLLFTSGSTGTPKGVEVPDSTLCNLVQWQQESGGLAEAAVTQQFSMLSFDVSFQEIFSTLCGGGLLRLVDPGWRTDVPALLDRLETGGAERLFLPYVALQLLAEHGVRLGRYPSRLREVITAGEQLLCTDAITRWFAGMPGARLFNHYGPTETHVVSALCLEGNPAAWPERPAIGRPVAGARLHVVDEADLPLPPGRTGHLLIGGTMAARCYANDSGLNESRFVDIPGEGTFYRSGDLAHFDHDGLLHYAGRNDQQIKLSGFRLELGQIEAALLHHPQIVGAVVVRESYQDTPSEENGHAAERSPQLTACLQLAHQVDGSPPPTHEELAEHLIPLLPSFVRVDRFRVLPRLPLTPSGKVDRRSASTAPGEELRPHTSHMPKHAVALTAREGRLTELFRQVLDLPIERDQSFFDAGATSLGLMRFHLRCTAEPDLRFSIPDLFEHVSIRRLAALLDDRISRTETGTGIAAEVQHVDTAEPVAVVGMAVRVPGADDLAAFWELIRTGASGIEYFDAPEGHVGARSQMSGLLAFDPEHFRISRQEARLMDPQQRHLLMSCVQALAHAGLAGPGRADRQPQQGPRIGLVASCGENTYFQSMLRDGDPRLMPDAFQLAIHHDKDFLTTKVAYHLDMTGPAFTIQAACASSLVAVHVAAGLLRQGDADVMLAGGVLVDTLLTDGYPRQAQHIFSDDGHCRGFSDDATGTVGASGVGVVVLKPLDLARRDGDTVYAVIGGSAVNNDGAEKLSYSAPALAGQRQVIQAALRRSGHTGTDLGYVEAHGTGTPMGDPIEVAALRQALGLSGQDSCALASVKSQIGHLGAAAGVVGLIRAVLAIHHGVVPPQVDFRRLNPRIGDDAAHFRISAQAAPWPHGKPRVAAVSSFGIGGTNAHVVLKADSPAHAPLLAKPVPGLLLLSGSSTDALRLDAARIADHLETAADVYDDVLRHLQSGRPARRKRAAAVCNDVGDAVAWLRTVAEGRVTPSDVPRQADEADFVDARGFSPGALAEIWSSGRPVRWPKGPAQAPWDFPPPAFALSPYDFPRRPAAATTVDGAVVEQPALDPATATQWPERLPEHRWLHQPQWVRRSRAAGATVSSTSHRRPLLVIMAVEPLPSHSLRCFETLYERITLVSVGTDYRPLGEGRYQVDPADAEALAHLLGILTDALDEDETVDWLHALPLSLDAAHPVGSASLAHARWACLDTPAALVQAAATLPRPIRIRPWWLSYGAQPVEGAVRRPEAGLLAGAAEVPAQEGIADSRWVDLPDANPTSWATALATLLAEAEPAGTHARAAAQPEALPAATPDPPRRLALRQGYWWQQALLPVPPPRPQASPAWHIPSAAQPSAAAPATYVVLGGTGGIGRALAAHLLTETGQNSRVVLVSRRPELPPTLAPFADRVDLVTADLAGTAPETVLALLEQRALRIDGVVHAAGVAAGGLLTGRDSTTASRATEAKLRGALLVEQMVSRHRPAFVVYCASMAAQYGGVGQFDYAAANGLLDGFAHYRAQDSESTLRIALDWDIWREGGMAEHALPTDTRHQAHLTVGLTTAEGKRVLDRALRLQLPHLMVSTTDPDRAAVFYTPTPRAAAVPAAQTSAGLAAHVTGWLCQSLGLADDELDPSADLYAYGADSLTMLELITNIEEQYGITVELSRLSHRVSVDEIITHLHPPTSVQDVRVEVWQRGTGDSLVCLVHPVGGDVQAYRALVSALDAELTVCLIADPALRVSQGAEDEIRGDAPGPSLAGRARDYYAALQHRFPHQRWRWQLAGWSFGALTAHAMAAEAEAAGRPVTALHLLDPPPPNAASYLSEHEEGIEAVFAQELKLAATHNRPHGTAPVSRTAQAYASRLARCCRANLAAMSRHELPHLMHTPSHLWLATEPTPGFPKFGTPDAQLVLWKAKLSYVETSTFLDTTHYGIVTPPHTERIAAAVSTSAASPRTNGG